MTITFMTVNEQKLQFQILSKIKDDDFEPDLVDVLDDEGYAQYICDLLNESGGDYIHYWVEPLPTEEP